MDTTTQWTWDLDGDGRMRARHIRGAVMTVSVTYDVTARREDVGLRITRPGMDEVVDRLAFQSRAYSTGGILTEARNHAVRWAAPFVEFL